MPHSKMKESIAHILKKEGYVAEVTVEGKLSKTIKLQAEVSGQEERDRRHRAASARPGLRRYVGATEIPRVRGGLGVSVVSTLRRRDDGQPGPQEESRRRIALLRLVRNYLLCHELENNR